MTEQPPTGITVTGKGTVGVVPDLLVARLGAETAASSVQAALDSCSAAASTLVAALKDAGVPDSDLATSGATVQAAYDDRGQPRGWSATQAFTARLRDLGSAGETVSKALGAAGDAGRLHDLSFAVDDDREARAEARRRAYADAAGTAQLYAELAGRRLGAVLAMRELDSHNGGIVLRAHTLGGGGGMPLEQGNLDITVSVEARWDFLG
jgi:uncharacterized protein YggE